MTKVDRHEQDEARRRRIARAAFELFARSGLEAISAADIARAAFVSRTNLYRYYPSKLHMLLAHFELTVEDSRQTALNRLRAGAAPQDIWQGVAGRMADLGVRYHHLVGAVASAVISGRGGRAGDGAGGTAAGGQADLNRVTASLDELVMPVLAAMQQRGELRDDVDLAQLSTLLVDTCLMALLQGQHRTQEEVQRDWQERMRLLLGGVLRGGQELVWELPPAVPAGAARLVVGPAEAQAEARTGSEAGTAQGPNAPAEPPTSDVGPRL